MSHVSHELHQEFPAAVTKIQELKKNNPHFATLADSYHLTNQEIYRIETELAPASDETLESLKKKRLHLKDEIAALLV